MNTKIAIIGEYHETFVPHTSLNLSLELIREDLGIDLEYYWIDTITINNNCEKKY